MKKLFLLTILALIIIPFNVRAINIIDGDLIRAENDIDVYIVKLVGEKKFKRLILNPEIFNQYGHLKWENIKDVNSAVLDEYMTSDLVRAVGDDKVYKLYPRGDIGEKRWIKTADDFLDFGYDWDAIYTINNFERDFYLLGEDLEAFKVPIKEGPAPIPSRNPITINVPSEYKTIQSAINAAIDGDTIKVNSGTYQENIVLNKNIKLIADYLSVILDGQGNGPAITIQGASDFLIQRFTIKSTNEKAIYCNGEALSRGIIKNSVLKDSGWGIYADGNCNLTLLNNLIYNNKDSNRLAGIGIFVKNNYSYGATSEIRNNTIDDNYQGIWAENSNLKIMNNIITNNLGLNNSFGIYHSGDGQSDNTFNNVWQNGFNYGGNAKAGNGSLVIDPRFVRREMRDYRLKTGAVDYSLCLDAGNPDLIYNDGIYSSNTARNDMGAYGGPDNIGWNP